MFTVDELIAEVRKLADENPDFVYDDVACWYLIGGNPDTPGCIIGRTIMALSPELKPILEKADETNENINGLFPMLSDFEFDNNTNEFQWLLSVQSSQDSGSSWEDAIELADENHSLD